MRHLSLIMAQMMLRRMVPILTPTLALPHQHVPQKRLKKLVLGWPAQVMTRSGSFKLLEGRNSANFACECLFSSWHYFSENFYRALHQDDHAVRVHSYHSTTATGSLRSHLLKHHPEEWVKECQRLNINMRGKEGEEAMARFTGIPVEHQAERRTPFTQDNFLDSLVQFIVATDQVFFVFHFFLFPHLI